MSRTISVPIGATTFHISKFDAFRQLELLGDLQKEVLPAAGGLLSAVFSEGGPEQARDDLAMAQALRDLSVRLGGGELKKWANLLIDPELVSFELSGRDPQKLTEPRRGLAFEDFSQILELMFHILMHNFSGPFAQWAGRFGPARAKLGTLSASLKPPSSES
ncbi:hypothetical protein AVE30378_02560 [Achromobacter veterisilvae]|uniref:Uncharacterized protein n=1 Tax=Achromobacter veterisilvae TaxID=2069367 RepID=A0A446CHH3_9BURK|nr:hypothetical protein [Achromobacter veterisilvae]SSW67319.1 hypothetical protein AVE30378_02560 [Achromobacter veterisilvae]